MTFSFPEQPMRDAIDNMNGKVLDGRNIATMESLVALLLYTTLALLLRGLLLVLEDWQDSSFALRG